MTTTPQTPPAGPPLPEPDDAAGVTGAARTTGATGATRGGIWNEVRGWGLSRDTSRRWLGGVCSGIANRLGVDPLLVRAGAVAIALTGGIGLVAYIVAWMILPDGSGRIVGQELGGDSDVAAGVIITLLVLAAVGLLSLGDSGWWFGWSLLPLALIAWIVLRARGGTPAPIGARDGAPAPIPAERYGTQPPTWQHPPPPRPIAPAPPPRPRRRPAGMSVGLTVIGLAVAAYGVGYLLDRPVSFPGSPHLLGALAALTVASLATLVIGWSGRRSALSSITTLVLIGATGIAAAAPHLASVRSGLADQTWRPAATSTSTAPASYDLGMGDATLDLTDATGAATTRDIRAHVGMGDLTVVVPPGADVAIRAKTSTGGIAPRDLGTLPGLTSHTSKDSGPGHELSATFGTSPTLTVHAEVGLGDIIIEER